MKSQMGFTEEKDQSHVPLGLLTPRPLRTERNTRCENVRKCEGVKVGLWPYYVPQARYFAGRPQRADGAGTLV